MPVFVAFGFVPLDQPIYRQQVPAYTTLEPGARHEGRVPRQVPMEAWHPNGKVDPLPEGTTRVLLERGTASGDGSLEAGARAPCPPLRSNAALQ